MRELKFRAWDIKNNHYVNVHRLILDQFGAIDYADVVYNGKLYKLYPSEVIIEQYTGLEDKNDKEIYEGDIVKTKSPDMPNFNAGAIVMQQQMYLIINTPTYNDPRHSHSETLGYYCDTECEVIGNIHENPELLEAKE